MIRVKKFVNFRNLVASLLVCCIGFMTIVIIIGLLQP